MRRLLFILILSVSLPACAQNNTGNELNNTNYSPVNVSPESKIIQDTTIHNQQPADNIEIIDTKDAQKASNKTKRDARNRKVSAEKKVETDGGVYGGSANTDTPVVPPMIQMKEQFESNQLNATHQYARRSASTYEQMNMEQSVQYYQAKAPESFESHLYTYLAGHYNIELYPELEKAATLDPENEEVKKQLSAYYIITNETPLALQEISGLIANNTVSEGQLSYAHDLLVSGQEESIIVTHGFDDMLPAYSVQNYQHVRQDVQLLSLDWMQSEAYRAQWEEKGLVLPESTVIDTAYLAAFCALNPDRVIQLSLTIPKDYFIGIKSKLYPVGLTLQYANAPIDNFSKNNELWKHEMTKGLLKEHGLNDPADKWSSNYLLMMITLSKQLTALNEKKEADTLNKCILELGERNNATDKVKKYTE